MSSNGGDPFDVVVIGAGMFGGYIADKLYRHGESVGLPEGLIAVPRVTPHYVLRTGILRIGRHDLWVWCVEAPSAAYSEHGWAAETSRRRQQES